MDKKIKEIIEDLNNSIDLKYSSECINVISDKEVMIDDEAILSHEQALRFFSERYNMQSFIKEKKMRVIKETLIQDIEKLNSKDEISVIDITTKDHNYMILKSIEKNRIFSIIRGFNSLEKKNRQINLSINNSLMYSLGISHYNKGKLIKRY